MARDYLHIGKRSWWSGKTVTLCGLTFADGGKEESFWSISGPKCPRCKKLKAQGRRL